MKRTTVMLALFLMTAAAQAADIATESWGVHREAALNAAPDLRQQAQRLLEKVLPDADLVGPTVGEAYFVDLDGNADLELVATVDYSGRGFFSNVVVVQRRQGGFDWTETRNNGRSIDGLPSHLIDADGDGRPELVLEQFMERYEGAQRVPMETVVYRWDRRGFRDDSAAYPEFYRTRIVPELERELARAAQPSSAQVRDDYEEFVLEAELARAKQRGRVK